jgi:hypothetical protein
MKAVSIGQTLGAKITKSKIQIEISKEGFEAFCNSTGLYRKEFLEALDASERDHCAGRMTKRKSLSESVKTERLRA